MLYFFKNLEMKNVMFTFANIETQLKKIKGTVTSPITPLLYLSFLTFPLYPFAIFTDGYKAYIFITIPTLTIIIFIIVYICLLVKKPESLRSEAFEFSKYLVERNYYGNKDKPFSFKINSDIPLIMDSNKTDSQGEKNESK